MSWARHLLLRLHERLRAAVTAVEAAAGLLDAVETAPIPPAAIEAMRNERLNRQSVNIETAAPVEGGETDELVAAASTCAHIETIAQKKKI
jgi:hypothetical protein